jgi:hypothetical protein
VHTKESISTAEWNTREEAIQCFSIVAKQGIVLAGDEPKFDAGQSRHDASKYIEDHLPRLKKKRFRLLGSSGFTVLAKFQGDWVWIVKVPFEYRDAKPGTLSEDAHVRVKDRNQRRLSDSSASWRLQGSQNNTWRASRVA